MIPSLFPLALYRGDTYRFQFRVWQDAEKTLPGDLTDVEVKAEIRDVPGGVAVVEMTCTVTLPNIIDVLLPAEESRLVPPKGVWDLQLTNAEGDVDTLVAGPVTQTADVTDSTLAQVASSGPSVFMRAIERPSGF